MQNSKDTFRFTLDNLSILNSIQKQRFPQDDSQRSRISFNRSFKDASQITMNFNKITTSYVDANSSDEEDKVSNEKPKNCEFYKRQNEKTRSELQSYQILKDNQLFIESNQQNIPLSANILILGEKNSGKKSLAKSIQQAYLLKNTYTNDNKTSQPQKQTLQNQYQKLSLLEQRKKPIYQHIKLKKYSQKYNYSGNQKQYTDYSGINLFNLQGNNRIFNEFIYEPEESPKKQKPLFSFLKFINQEKKPQKTLENSSHTLIYTLDGSQTDIFTNKQTIQNLQDNISFARQQNLDLQIVLTKIDLLEKQIQNNYKNQISQTNIQMMIHESIDNIITNLQLSLDIPRENIHFLENYNTQIQNDEQLDYYLLNLLEKSLKKASDYIYTQIQEQNEDKNYMQQNMCKIFSFCQI